MLLPGDGEDLELKVLRDAFLSLSLFRFEGRHRLRHFFGGWCSSWGTGRGRDVEEAEAEAQVGDAAGDGRG